MFRVMELAGPLIFVLWVFCLIEVIVTSEHVMRNLPKLAWLFLVLLFPLVGSVAWLVAGRPEKSASTPRPTGAYERQATSFPEYDRPGRAAGLSGEADEEFLRRCRERAEEQREAHRRKQEQGGSEKE